MAEIDLGKVKMTDKELEDKIVEVNGGVRLGKDAEGNYGYYKYDEEAGADTFVPFSRGGGIASPLIWRMYIPKDCYVSTTAINNYTYFPKGIKKIVIKSAVISGYRASSSSYSRSVYLYISGTKRGETKVTQTTILNASLSSTSASSPSVTKKTDFEVDLSEYDSEKDIFIHYQTPGNGNYGVYVTADVTAELYF